MPDLRNQITNANQTLTEWPYNVQKPILRSAAIIFLTAQFILPGTLFARDSSVILITPQGDILDYVPEVGEVAVRIDRQGRRVLVDHYGSIVAYEIPDSRNQRQRREYRRWEQENEPGAITGAVPPPRPQRNTSVKRQPLPAAPGDEKHATLGEPTTPQPLEEPPIQSKKEKLDREIVTALQVFLDREGFSPGVIDGEMGSNVEKAIAAWEATKREKLDPSNTEDILQRLSLDGGLPFKTYEISPSDAAGPYVAEIPADYAQKASLPALSFTSTAEKLAEQFHMSEAYLKALNPNTDFSVPGTRIKVVDPGENKKANIARIVANKRIKQVQAFDENGNMIAAYPATIGSSDTPSPSGTVTVERIALDPNYTYNPKINFQQGNNRSVLTIPPGPNGPVGNVWIALSKPTYGIHGTPDPDKIGKTASHGCVRLTNWDARELAKMVKPGVIVQFVD